MLSLYPLILCASSLAAAPARPTPPAPTPPLAPVSAQLVASLSAPLSIKAYASLRRLPEELAPLGQDLRDLLDRYAQASQGKLTWQLVDPDDRSRPAERERLLDQAHRCGIQPIRVDRYDGEKIEVTTLYLGLCLTYGDTTRALPRITGPVGLEYLISSTIKQTTQGRPRLAFTTGHGERTPEEGLRTLRPDLEADFALQTLNPSVDPIDDRVDALVVGGPRKPFDDQGRRALDRFLMTGRSVLFLVDGAVLAETKPARQGKAARAIAQPNDAGLDPLLANYGFKIQRFTIADPAHPLPGPILREGRRALVNDPMCIGVAPPSTPALSIFDGVGKTIIFPYASPVTRIAPPSGEKPGSLWSLGETDPASLGLPGTFLVDRPILPTKARAKGPFTIGYAFQGRLPSAYAPDPSTRPVRLVVLGDSEFTSDDTLQLARFFRTYSEGALLFLNAVNWLVEDGDLAPLRHQRYRPPPVPASAPGQAPSADAAAPRP